jgi:hypothetical protein
MDTKTVRAQQKVEREQSHTEWEKERAFIKQGLHDLVDKKTTIDELKTNPFWQQLKQNRSEELKMLNTMAVAVIAKEKPLIALILEENERGLSLIFGDAAYALGKWIEKNGSQTTIDLYKAVSGCNNYLVELNRKMTQGFEIPHLIMIKIIRERREKLLHMTARFQEENPEFEEKVRRKNPAELQPHKKASERASIEAGKINQLVQV